MNAKKILMLMGILVAGLLAACSFESEKGTVDKTAPEGVVSEEVVATNSAEAEEKGPKKDYYYIVGYGAGNYKGKLRPQLLVNYKGKLRQISARNRDIEAEVTSLVGSCMYGFIDGEHINAVIKKCPPEMVQK